MSNITTAEVRELCAEIVRLGEKVKILEGQAQSHKRAMQNQIQTLTTCTLHNANITTRGQMQTLEDTHATLRRQLENALTETKQKITALDGMMEQLAQLEEIAY